MPRPVKKYKSLDKEIKTVDSTTEEEHDVENDDLLDELQEIEIEPVYEDTDDKEETTFFYTERESWIDDKSNIKFKPGDLVVSLTGKGDMVYKVGPPSTDYNTYFATLSGARDAIIIKGERFKIAPKKVKWVAYIPNKF